MIEVPLVRVLQNARTPFRSSIDHSIMIVFIELFNWLFAKIQMRRLKKKWDDLSIVYTNTWQVLRCVVVIANVSAVSRALNQTCSARFRRFDEASKAQLTSHFLFFFTTVSQDEQQLEEESAAPFSVADQLAGAAWLSAPAPLKHSIFTLIIIYISA